MQQLPIYNTRVEVNIWVQFSVYEVRIGKNCLFQRYSHLHYSHRPDLQILINFMEAQELKQIDQGRNQQPWYRCYGSLLLKHIMTWALKNQGQHTMRQLLICFLNTSAPKQKSTPQSVGRSLQWTTLHLPGSIPPIGHINRHPFSEALDCYKELSMSLQSCTHSDQNVR